jgi:hypothetical protein
MRIVELDSKHEVLFAIYAEYQKDIIDMKSVSFKSLEMDSRVFITALLKLKNEGFIEGLVVHPPNARRAEKVIAIMMEDVMPTRFGVEYVENKLEIKQDLSAQEKLKLMAAKFGKFGFEILKKYVVMKLESFV